jgi:AhpD family alkylhydroperoxidase
MVKSPLSDKVREQIAIGVSVVAKCQPCFQYHLKEAKKSGVSDNEIEAVIKLARKIRSVADQKMDEFIGETLNGAASAATETDHLCCSSAEEPKKESGCC